MAIVVQISSVGVIAIDPIPEEWEVDEADNFIKNRLADFRRIADRDRQRTAEWEKAELALQETAMREQAERQAVVHRRVNLVNRIKAEIIEKMRAKTEKISPVVEAPVVVLKPRPRIVLVQFQVCPHYAKMARPRRRR